MCLRNYANRKWKEETNLSMISSIKIPSSKNNVWRYSRHEGLKGKKTPGWYSGSSGKIWKGSSGI